MLRSEEEVGRRAVARLFHTVRIRAVNLVGAIRKRCSKHVSTLEDVLDLATLTGWKGIVELDQLDCLHASLSDCLAV